MAASEWPLKKSVVTEFSLWRSLAMTNDMFSFRLSMGGGSTINTPII
jgi:hypothetical protein